MTTDELIAIEEIRRLKAQYFYAVDTKDWDLCEGLFTPDAVIDFSDEGDFASQVSAEAAVVQSQTWVFSGGAKFRRWVEPALQGIVSVHNGHDPIITLGEEGTASAVWPMSDRLETRSDVFLGFGYYHDEYRLVDDEWRIGKQVLKRLLGVWEPRGTARLPSRFDVWDAAQG